MSGIIVGVHELLVTLNPTNDEILTVTHTTSGKVLPVRQLNITYRYDPIESDWTFDRSLAFVVDPATDAVKRLGWRVGTPASRTPPWLPRLIMCHQPPDTFKPYSEEGGE